MSPSHVVKKGKRYRYYLSQAYLRKQKELAGSLPQVSATELEQTSSDFVKQKLEELLGLDNYSIEKYQLYKSNLESYFIDWVSQNKEVYFIVRCIISKVVISDINIIYYLNPIALKEIFELIITKQNVLEYQAEKISENDYELIIISCELKKVNQGKTLIIGKQETR